MEIASNLNSVDGHGKKFTSFASKYGMMADGGLIGGNGVFAKGVNSYVPKTNISADSMKRLEDRIFEAVVKGAEQGTAKGSMIGSKEGSRIGSEQGNLSASERALRHQERINRQEQNSVRYEIDRTRW